MKISTKFLIQQNDFWYDREFGEIKRVDDSHFEVVEYDHYTGRRPTADPKVETFPINFYSIGRIVAARILAVRAYNEMVDRIQKEYEEA